MALEVHPIVRDLFPPMAPDAFQELCKDIRTHGLQDPIWVYEGKVLDGDHRSQACQLEGVEPQILTYMGNDPLGFAVSKNLYRRHLSAADRKKIAKRLLAETPSLSDNAIAKQAKVSPHTVAKARAELAATEANLPDANKESHESQQPIPDSAGSSSSGEDAGIAPALQAENPETGVRVPQASDTPPPRKEVSGRKARGRKPGTAKPPTEIKPKTATNPREQWLVGAGALVKANAEQFLRDVTAIITDETGRLCKVGEHTRRQCLEKIAAGLGLKIVS